MTEAAIFRRNPKLSIEFTLHALSPIARRQGSAVPGTLIEGPDAWYAKDYAGTEKHIYHLSEQDLVELDAAVASVEASGIDIKVGARGPTLPQTLQSCKCSSAHIEA